MHPEKIGPYHIDRKIGSGGMGNVYHGTHEQTGQEVAVKVLPASMAREEGFVLRFSREIKAMRALSSPYIVKVVLDGETDDGSYYYSMEFVDGETLTSMVSRRKRIPWREVIDVSLDIAAALKSAHDSGIVHRDLKPSNLMVSKDGQIKLTDFGVAHMFATTRLTRTGGVVGTAEYMSPEQARGKRATKRSDLYSLGAVMYVMLTGRPPFTGKLASDVLHQHQFAQFDKPGHYVSDLPRQLEEFVCTLLEKKPEKRFPDALVVMRKLENVRSQIDFALKSAVESSTQLSDSPATDHTAGLAADRTQGSHRMEHRPGPATMVRDAVREDIARQYHKSPVAKFFDNTLVLLILFGLVIVVGYYFSRTTIPDPAEQLQVAQELMQAEAGPGWLRARDEILLGLLRDDAFPEHRQEIQALVDRADQYDFCRRLRVTMSTDGSQDSELERLVRRAFSLYSDGTVSKAARELEAVRTVIEGQPRYEYLSEFLEATLRDWNSERDVASRRRFVQDVLAHAARLVEMDGGKQQAAALLDSALVLYSDDSAVEAELTRCRELRQSIAGE